jgi:hypothetical protein
MVLARFESGWEDGAGVFGWVAFGLATIASFCWLTLLFVSLTQRERTGRHATIQPGHIHLTVATPTSPGGPDQEALRSIQYLGAADLAIIVFPHERRAQVSKYRYGPTDAVAVSVTVVKVRARSMSFDADAFRRAFQAQGMIAHTATEPASPVDLADAGLQVVAEALGFSREEANELMAECLKVASGKPDADPQEVRQNIHVAGIAVGLAFGYLGALRAEGTEK